MRTYFCAEGGNLGRVAERARARGVSLYRLKISGGRLSFCTKSTDAATMIAILENLCYHKVNPQAGEARASGGKTYRVRGLTSPKKLLSRAALALFALCFLVCCWYVDGRVLEIRIESDNPALVARMLDEYGIKRGQRVEHIKEAEAYLNQNLDARYVFVRQRGVRLTVEVWARDDRPLERAQKQIVAPCDGVVESVVLLSGTALVKAGDEVKAGDVLIDGVICSEDGGRIETKAVGSVGIVCPVEKVYEYDTVRRTSYRTGRSSTYTETDFLFGRYGKVKNPFAEYEQVVTESVLNQMFPVRMRRVDVYELAWLEETVDFDKVKDFVVKEMIDRATQECEDEVLSATAEAEGEGQVRTVRVKLETLVHCGGNFDDQDL